MIRSIDLNSDLGEGFGPWAMGDDSAMLGIVTSAKIACLAADGKLAPGAGWVQESVVGSQFHASYRIDPAGHIIPRIRGRAFVVAEARLLRHPDDPFADGMRL